MQLQHCYNRVITHLRRVKNLTLAHLQRNYCRGARDMGSATKKKPTACQKKHAAPRPARSTPRKKPTLCHSSKYPRRGIVSACKINAMARNPCQNSRHGSEFMRKPTTHRDSQGGVAQMLKDVFKQPLFPHYRHECFCWKIIFLEIYS